MKNCKKVFCLVLIVMLVLSFTACGKSNELVGKWESVLEDNTATYQFKKNMDVIYSVKVSNVAEVNLIGTYEIDEEAKTFSVTFTKATNSNGAIIDLEGTEYTSIYKYSYEITEDGELHVSVSETSYATFKKIK